MFRKFFEEISNVLAQRCQCGGKLKVMLGWAYYTEHCDQCGHHEEGPN